MNDEIVIRALGLRKSYRLYTRSRYRVLDALGLLSKNKGRYKEHLAIDGIDLNIYRGEKVGIIGRNGAGKSTRFVPLVPRAVEVPRVLLQ